MTGSIRKLLIGAALTGILTGSNAIAQSSKGDDAKQKAADSGKSAKKKVVGDKHACKGQNSCKGKGGCMAGDNGCKGRNSCKGKGGCATDGSKSKKK